MVNLYNHFSNIKVNPRENYSGIVVLRVNNQSKNGILRFLVLPVLKREDLTARLWIVKENKIRVREYKS